MEEEDTVTQTPGSENSLQSDCNEFDSQDPDKALTLVHSVLTRRQQAVQVRAPRAAPQPLAWVPVGTPLVCITPFI